MNPEIKDGVRERIRLTAQKIGSGDELSRRSGVPRRTLENYLSGRSEPKATALAAIAAAASVSLDWLIVGQEPRGPASSAASPVEVPLMAKAIAVIEAETEDVNLTPVDKAQIYAEAYLWMLKRRAAREAEAADGKQPGGDRDDDELAGLIGSLVRVAGVRR